MLSYKMIHEGLTSDKTTDLNKHDETRKKHGKKEKQIYNNAL